MTEHGRLQALEPAWLLVWCRGLLAANGLFWLVAAFGLVLGPWARAGVGILIVLMIANGAVLLGLSRWLRGLGPSVLIAAPLWVAVNLILTLTDQVGPADLAVMVLNAITLLLLLTLGVVWWRRRVAD